MRYTREEYEALKTEVETAETENYELRRRADELHRLKNLSLPQEEKDQLGVGGGDKAFLSPSTRFIAWPRTIRPRR